MPPYQNPHIYTKTKEYFTSKDNFSVEDITTWLLENEEEYKIIYQRAKSCKDCNSNIRDVGSDAPFTFCSGNLPTEEYKFYDFYKNIRKLKECYSRNSSAKSKLEEYEKIINNDEKVREWLIENEEDYYSFWKDNSHRIVTVGSKILYYFKPVGAIEYIKFFIEKISFEYSFALSNLLEILYPKNNDVYDFWEIMKNKEEFTFNSKCLKPFIEKDTFSLKELATWLEENKHIRNLTSVRYSINERFESTVAVDIEWALRCKLPDLQELIKFSKDTYKFIGNKSVKNLMTAFDLRQPQIKNNNLLMKVVEEVRETGAYAIYKENWLTIKITSKELTPLVKLVEEFDTTYNEKSNFPF